MNRRAFLGAGVASLSMLGLCLSARDNLHAAAKPSRQAPAQAAGTAKALPPADFGSMTLMDCCKARHSDHALPRGELDRQTIANLCWAAWGVNRADGKRVVPTAMNRQEAALLVALKDGVWQYDGHAHSLTRVLAGDQRPRFDGAACVLLYAGPDRAKMPEMRGDFAAFHIGSMYQNVGLYCGAAGLHNCVKWQKHDALDGELPLPRGWSVLMTQSVGKP